MTTDFIPAAEDLDLLLARLNAAARKIGFDPYDQPGLTRAWFKGGEGTEKATLSASDLPTETRSLRFDRYTFLLALMPDEPTPESVGDCVRRFRNQCVIARSFLAPNEALDLQGILMGPRGSDQDDDWKAIALMVERDDRVVRKFVWLRPAKADEEDASFEDLLRRSALARPWISDAEFTMAALDNINRLAAGTTSSVPRDLMDDWIRLALSDNPNPDRLVDQLISAAQARNAV